MIGTKKVICVIPARLASSRFPKKILQLLGGKPLLQWAYEAAQTVPLFDEVVLAIDAEETASVVQRFGGTYVMTSSDCACGTDRLIEVMRSKKEGADIWVNWQADEPFITNTMIEQLLQTSATDGADVWTLQKKISSTADITNPNVVKVVCDAHGCALYFSRHPIPFHRDVNAQGDVPSYYKHVGMYAYTTKALQKIAQLTPTKLEVAEKLEQLRFLQNRLAIKVHETDHEGIGIDTPQDLANAELFLTTGC